MAAPEVSRRLHTAAGTVLSRLVWGAWRLLDAGLSAQQVNRLIHHCVERGITSFDHADLYGGFGCEALFGQALSLSPGLRGRIELLTKCGISPVTAARPQHRIKHYDSSPAHIVRSVDASLSALRTDALDLLMIHRPDPLMDAAATAQALDAVVAQGKVRAIGVSNFSVHQVELLASFLTVPLVVNQVECSLLQRQALGDGVLDQCQRRRMVPMAWSPLAGGALLATGDPAPAAARRLAPVLQRLAGDHGVTPDAIALAWLLAHPGQIVPVLGSHRPERIDAAVDALGVELDRQSWFELLEAAQGHPVA